MYLVSVILHILVRLFSLKPITTIRYMKCAHRGLEGIWSKSPIPKSPFTKSPFAERPMLKRALFIGNQLGLVSVYMSVESDKKVLDWF